MRTKTSNPNLLRRLNERTAFELIRRHGQMSRPELKRRMGVTAPTVSKAVAHLLAAGLLEEVGLARFERAGRPVVVYRLARGSVRVLGVLVGVRECVVMVAGLDGVVDDTQTVRFDMPGTYSELISRTAEALLPLSDQSGVTTLGVGLGIPGELDVAAQKVLLSPNLHILNGKSPGRDLQKRLGVPVRLVHDTIASALAEQQHGAARDLTDFVRIGIYEGFGVSVVSGGRLLQGHRGLAGELGHIAVNPDGELCGCGNRGCLETVATDAAFARMVSRRVKRQLTIEQVVDGARRKELDVARELDETLGWLAVGLAAAINLFNPQAILLTSRMLDADAKAFDRLKAMTISRAMKAMAQDCRIIRVEENVRQGIIAATISHIIKGLGPTVD